MIDRSHYGIVTFPSSQAAGQAELEFREAGRTSRLIPLPPQISAGCGLVLQFPWAEVEETVVFLEQTNLHDAAIYEVTLTENRRKNIRIWKKNKDEER